MPSTPEPGASESADEEEPWLTGHQVAKVWPVRAHYLPNVAHRADVRVRTFGGESRGTYGAAPIYHRYHPGDVRRAAVAIAEGRVGIPSKWRTDTPKGRRAEYWEGFAFSLACSVWLAAGLLMVGLLIYALVS